jgi:predicted  nucleic acid-binding Zn-ribbon protein
MTQAASLLALQDLDIEIMRAKKRLDELPEKREILAVRQKARDVTDLHGKADLLVKKLQADLKAHQDEITTLAEKIAGEQTKVMATTDHRAVQSITREMDGLRRRQDKMEMESLQLMERIDKASAQILKIDEALKQLADKDAALVARFKSVGGALQAEIADMERRREQTAASIDVDVVSRYEQIRESKGGVGVGRLDGEACSACRMSLPAERVRELQSGDDISVCPQCRRLIVVRVESMR